MQFEDSLGEYIRAVYSVSRMYRTPINKNSLIGTAASLVKGF